ncbi:multiubiquitin domain-containing protein [Bradyrhizobium roseum]|uniref:multiubiquitin domain-containing protein n=1 Tax=Bradyrhizobium roseum TaxID=3056648 RepID=UPI002602EEDC|nr:multiubiquitin domain-containing protein [Bradyrhizobium roseus]WKA26222.1 multiubiquitin domain-containing protein [Bradyrhizobium roseus]
MTDNTENKGVTPGDNVLEGGAQTLSEANFRIKIAGADLNFRNLSLDDAKPTGHQIVAAAGFRPVENYGVLQWLDTGDLEPLRLNETVDLRPGGAERFVIAQTDRAFFFELEGERQEWLLAFINGITLKRLAGKDPESVIVLLEREDAPDEEIEDEQTVDLSGAGLEKFRIRPVEKLVGIFVNEKLVKIERGEHTGLEIKQAAIAQGVQIQLDFVLSLEKRQGETQIIGDNDSVKVKKGQKYVAIADDDNS